MKRHGKLSTVLGIILLTGSCTYYTNESPPVPEEKPDLEAAFVKDPPVSLTSSYWNTADYVVVNVSDININQIAPEEGLLNVNGMYNGVASFNGGEPAQLTLKAAYDQENIYILATWQDKTYNVSGNNWMINGPFDSLKNASGNGLTSQGSDDDLVLAFARDGSTRDIWKWSLALSEPMGYAIDMTDDGTSRTTDSGDKVFVRNAVGDPYLSGPQYEWNGQQQELTRDPGGAVILDPAYFLLNKTEFTEDLANGAERYNGYCSFCHGINGQGHAPYDTAAVALNEPGKYGRIGLDAISGNLSSDSTHPGAHWWNQLSEQDQKDVYARLRAFTGIPGYYLQNPSGSASDIRSLSNVQLSRINTSSVNAGYKVLLIRKLNTGNDDDVAFDLTQGRQYDFDVYLSDDDNNNLVGKNTVQLIFK